MFHPYKHRFPRLYAAYAEKHGNIGPILEVIDNYCKHLFNLDELEQMHGTADWPAVYGKFFEDCIKNAGDGYLVEEVCQVLFPYLHRTINDPAFGDTWCDQDFSKKGNEIGFMEKYRAEKLGSDLSKHEVLQNYAFTTLDMSRTAKRSEIHPLPHVLELKHLNYIPIDKKRSYFIRSSEGDKKGLPQWILLYIHKDESEYHLYSESPISQEDIQAIKNRFGPKEFFHIEGDTAALSMSSGIRVCSHYVNHFGGAGLSSSADYFSLLIEWVFFTLKDKAPDKRTDWNHFKRHVLRFNPANNSFRLLDLYSPEEKGENLTVNEHIQMRSYYLGLDLVLEKLEMLKRDRINHSVTLDNKLKRDVGLIWSEYSHYYSRRVNYFFDPQKFKEFPAKEMNKKELMELVKEPLFNQEFMRACVLNVFRTCAKEKHLEFKLDKNYKLSNAEEALIYFLMQSNPFVCSINTHGSKILGSLPKRLLPIFSRNEWLSVNGYLPPLLDDFWGVAAGYWLSYLKTFPDLLGKEEAVEKFKFCVWGMGQTGLESFLNYLEDKQRELKPGLTRLQKTSDNPLVFYAACSRDNPEKHRYHETLLKHIEGKKYFPFKKIYFTALPGEADLIALLDNSQEISELIIDVTPGSVPRLHSLRDTLYALIDASVGKNWVCPIRIPSLEGKPEGGAFTAYARLNNIIIENARRKAAKEALEPIEYFKTLEPLKPKPALEEKSAEVKESKSSRGNTALLQEFQIKVKELPEEGTRLSLIRAGGTGLQIQQQLQVQQQRATFIEPEMEKAETADFEDILPSELINYNNIYEKLYAYSSELKLDETKATLKAANEHILQSFFRTWVNANPEVPAKHIIREMSPLAARMLLKDHRQFSAGLSVAELSKKGAHPYYIKRIAGKLVLGYRSGLGFASSQHPLNPPVTTAIPKTERVLGDAEQFGNKGIIPKDDYELFQQIQPDGPPNGPPIKKGLEILFREQKTPAIELLSQKLKHIRPLGQIYSRYGEYGLERFSNLILSLQNTLGDPFLTNFFTTYLSQCETFTPLLKEDALAALHEMTIALAKDPHEKALFEVFLKVQMETQGWQSLPVLWNGFHYFYTELKNMNLERGFKSEFISDLKPKGQDLFPCFRRILDSLQHLPSTELRQAFIKILPECDLSEGGVPYAICHEGFIQVDKSLELTNFKDGSPTYAPPLDKLFTDAWHEPLHTQRALSAHRQIKPKDYQILINKKLSKHELMWVLHTEWENAEELSKFLENYAKHPMLPAIAEQLHKVCYGNQPAQKRLPLAVFANLAPYWEVVGPLLEKYPNQMSVFECIGASQDKDEILRQIILFREAPTEAKHLTQGFLLASKFGVSSKELNAFYDQTENLKSITSFHLLMLTEQLLSVLSVPENLTTKGAIWQTILEGIQIMDANPAAIADKRKELMQTLKTEHQLAFKSSVSGEYRPLQDADLEEFAFKQFFPQHASRLSQFFKERLALSQNKQDMDALAGIVDFFKRLQLNKTQINEIEPLLSLLEKCLAEYPRACWSAPYFQGLLRLLQPKADESSFPTGILEALLTEKPSPFIQKSIDEVEVDFDKNNPMRGIITQILAKKDIFNQKQQGQLASIAMRAMPDLSFIPQLMDKLGTAPYQGLSTLILDRLMQADKGQIQMSFNFCETLILIPHEGISLEAWRDTCRLWIEATSKTPQLEKVLATSADSKQNALILHIIAWSSFPLKRNAAKVHKLAKRLSELNKIEIEFLASLYPGKPTPDTRQLLSIIKKRAETNIWMQIKEFQTEKQAKFRQDYQRLSSTSEADFARLLKDTTVTRGEKNEYIDAESGLKISLMFQYLKRLEAGISTEKPINQLTREELQELFQETSKDLQDNPKDELLQTKLWALLFEAIGRTTGKYPHLAQQFALIAGDVLLADDPSKIFEIKTGEGKSHLIALRLARNVGLGLKVDVPTAKSALVERDQLDFQQFFDYLNIPTTSINARSNQETYTRAAATYTTPGDLSLFLDEQTMGGKPIAMGENYAICDEFDFLYYEGQKTQLNYSIASLRSPKEMAWFYRAINAYYDEYLKDNPRQAINLNQCYKFLQEQANEDGSMYLESLTALDVLQRLESAHQAASKEPGEGYSLLLGPVIIGDRELMLQEIIPVTEQMEPVFGSTFTQGVHQLLATRLNEQAAKDNQPQNYHVPAESQVVSSQVFSQRLKTIWKRWEGWTGTLSASQAQDLYAEHQTAVLRVPTRQKDLRKWPSPRFFNTAEARLQAIADDLKEDIKNKKSVLWSCRTDKEIDKLMQEDIKHFFTPKEYNYFLPYTNASAKTPAQILQQKKDLEAEEFGENQRGVGLIGARFGRGDDLGVEAVIVTYVRDDNDLGQVGGRTGRNGAEGEVRQYYLIPEIKQDLIWWIRYLRLDLETFKITEESVEEMDPERQFSLLLRLREFGKAKDNYLSRFYNETRAALSTEGSKMIGKSSPETREGLKKMFANYLEDLDRHWARIQIEHNHDRNRCIAALTKLIAADCKPGGQLAKSFQVEQLDVEIKPPKEPKLVLGKGEPKPREPKEELMVQVQSLLLKLTDLPADREVWAKLIEHLKTMDGEGLQSLLQQFKKKRTFTVAEVETALQERPVLISPAPVPAVEMAVRNFLDRFIEEEKEEREEKVETIGKKPSYNHLLEQFSSGLEHQTDLRLRLLASYEAILNATNADKRLLLQRFSKITVMFKAPEHLKILQQLLEKLKKEYQEPRKMIGDLDNLWTELTKIGPNLKSFLPLIKATLAKEGKEFVPCLAAICQLTPEFIQVAEPFLLSFFPKKPAGKHMKIWEYEKTLQHLQRIFEEDQNKYRLLMQLFQKYLSSDFFDSDNFYSIERFLKLDNIAEKLKPFEDNKSIHILLKLRQYAPGQEENLLKRPRLIERLKNLNGEKLIKTTQLVGKLFSLSSPKVPLEKLEAILLEHAFSDNCAVNEDFVAIERLLGRLSIDELSQLIPKFHNPSALHNFLSLVNTFSVETDLLIAMQSFLVELFNTGASYTKVTSLIRNIIVARIPIHTIEVCTKEYKAENIRILLKLCTENLDQEPKILLSSLPFIRQEFHADIAIQTFFKHYPKTDWVAKELFEPQADAKRLALMKLLYHEAFVSRVEVPAGISKKDNKALFDSCLEQYRKRAGKILEGHRATNAPRDLSGTQQKQLFKIMDDLEKVATSPARELEEKHEEGFSSINKEAKELIDKKIQSYKNDAWFKDNARYRRIEGQIIELQGQMPSLGYKAVMDKITNIKKTLMRQDVQLASGQFIPRLHFWGTSRLYKTLNNIEDTVLIDWVNKSTHYDNIKDAKAFKATHETLCTEYIKTFKEELATWNKNREKTLFSWFKNNSGALAKIINKMNDKELVEYLRSNPKIVKSLPGVLMAIANEVLAHAEIQQPPPRPG